jgi:hypothetical protein
MIHTLYCISGSIKDDPIGERKIMKSVEREIFIEK